MYSSYFILQWGSYPLLSSRRSLVIPVPWFPTFRLGQVFTLRFTAQQNHSSEVATKPFYGWGHNMRNRVRVTAVRSWGPQPYRNTLRVWADSPPPSGSRSSETDSNHSRKPGQSAVQWGHLEQRYGHQSELQQASQNTIQKLLNDSASMYLVWDLHVTIWIMRNRKATEERN